MHTGTQTRSKSSTMTVARVVAVMAKVHDDLWAFQVRGALTAKSAEKWRDDLIFLMVNHAISFFEFQIYHGSRRLGGVRYEIFDNGSLFEDNNSGGLDLWGLPDGVWVKIVIQIKSGLVEWLSEKIRERGFTEPATALSGTKIQDHTYSKEGYGVVRYIFGSW